MNTVSGCPVFCNIKTVGVRCSVICSTVQCYPVFCNMQYSALQLALKGCPVFRNIHYSAVQLAEQYIAVGG